MNFVTSTHHVMQNHTKIMADIEEGGFTQGRLGHYARELTQEEREGLQRDCVLVSEFKRNKLEQEAKKNWDLFYKRNSTHFFKDRHWITREFPELLTTHPGPDQCDAARGDQKMRVLLEAGCGVGNSVFPLVEENRDLFVYACDFSPRAIEFLKGNPSFSEDRCHAFVCDLTRDNLCDSIREPVDMVSLFFVLSAIAPEKMVQALRNVHNILQIGGLVLFRDYGLYDHAQLRFGKGHKIEENFYVRQDGTRAYYFSEEKLSELAEEAGFEVVTSGYVQKETVNHKEQICAPRIFLQAKLRKRFSKLK